MKITQSFLVAASAAAIAATSFVAGAWAQNVSTDKNQVGLWHWPDSMDSVNAAPKNHKVLFENDHVRLLEVIVQPGEKENMHGHKYPSVFMMDAPQPKMANRNLEEGKRPSRANGDRRPPPPHPNEGGIGYPTCRAMTTPQTPHQVTNLDTFPQHFYRMEFKKIDGDAVRSMKEYPSH